MGTRNVERFVALPAYKVVIFGETKTRKRRLQKRGGGRGWITGHITHRAHERFYFMPTFCEVVVIIRFKLALSAAAVADGDSTPEKILMSIVTDTVQRFNN